MNPILLYELRQSVRNRSIHVAIMLYLAAMVALTAVACLGEVELLDRRSDGDFFFPKHSAQEQLAQTLILLYYIVAGLVLIGFGAIKTAYERINGDLIYTTALTPGRIVWGKVQLGIIVSLFFGSMTLPFLALAYLGNGVDIVAVLLAFLFVFTATQTHYATTLAMFAGATSLTAVFARLLPWFIGQALLFLSVWIVFVMTWGRDWGVFCFGLIATTAVLCTIMYLLATAQFMPETANRMFAMRIGLTILIGVLSVAVFVAMMFDENLFNQSDIRWLEGLGFSLGTLSISVCMLLPYIFLIFICERTEYSNRQRQRIPLSLIGRLIAFPFYSGVANAMTWSVGLLLYGIAYFSVIDYCRGSDSKSYELTTFTLLFFNYCATSLLVCNLLLRKWISRRWYWVPVCVLVCTIFSVSFVSSWFPPYGGHVMQFFRTFSLLPNPWQLDYDDTAYRQLLVELWLGALCAAGLPWVVRAFRKFRRACPGKTHRVE